MTRLRRETRPLHDDLEAAILLTRPGIRADSLPLSQDLPPLPGLPAALGSVYVFEGSTLGGMWKEFGGLMETPRASVR